MYVEPITRRYVRFTSQDVDYRVYYEEAGSGPVILGLHTAGAHDNSATWWQTRT